MEETSSTFTKISAIELIIYQKRQKEDRKVTTIQNEEGEDTMVTIGSHFRA